MYLIIIKMVINQKVITIFFKIKMVINPIFLIKEPFLYYLFFYISLDLIIINFFFKFRM